MYDSANPHGVPLNAQMVAGYVDGDWVWSAADWAIFPNAIKVRIAIHPNTNDGHVLDIEPGNWPASASVDWTILRRNSGLATPTIYCGTWEAGYNWGDVLAAHDARGVARPQIWLAYWDGVQVIPEGCIAKQYANSAMLGFDADASVVADYWPGVDAAPAPPGDPCTEYRQNAASAISRIAQAQSELAEAIADITYT
jgi:hypothetical protein